LKQEEQTQSGATYESPPVRLRPHGWRFPVDGMNTIRRALRIFLFTLLVAAPAPAAPGETSPLGYRAADPKAPVVTAKNLVASERFWPYRVSLTRAWQPPGREKPIASGEAGVLVRIDANTRLARIDFGRGGVQEVPVDRTDLIDSANRIRLGELGKLAPNFVTAMGPRLIDPTADSPRAVEPATFLDRQGFLCVFADPSADSFSDLVKALAPLANRRGVATVFLPQGKISDRSVWDRLHALGWQVPYVYAHLSAGYTDSLLPAKTPMPALLLQTPEGRVLFESTFRPGVEVTLRSKLDDSFGPAPH
jgi:hypothetical protein